ncbi:terminase small subunit [Peptacetobacter sp.]|uniref:terminase small subunit n=1 Tax=Peptacetobacter sp. TaxID=2991975 RepID=UPI002F429FAC
MYGLTIKQKKFADEYIISGNATEAYKKAGYKYSSDNMASVEASKLLRNPKVKSYIEERMKEIESNKIADQKEVMEYLTSVMRGNEKQEQLITIGLGEGMTRAETFDVEVSAKERIRAAELIGKRYGMWTDKQDVNIELPIFIDDVPEED